MSPLICLLSRFFYYTKWWDGIPMRIMAADLYRQNTECNEMMAMSVLGCLPVLLLYLFFQRYFIAGMTAGSVKG